MKSFALCFLAYIAAVSAADSFAASIKDTVREEVHNALRGKKSPLEMTPEETERETIFLCSIINTVLPGETECECTNRLIQGEIGFTCTSDEFQCSGISAGQLCSKTFIDGDIDIRFLDLSASVAIQACAKEATINSTVIGEPLVLGDICLSIGAIAGLSGSGITGCSASIAGTECSACENCDRPGSNSTGIGFECEAVGLEICIPIGIPIFVDEVTADLGVADISDPAIWDKAATQIAEKVAIAKVEEVTGR